MKGEDRQGEPACSGPWCPSEDKGRQWRAVSMGGSRSDVWFVIWEDSLDGGEEDRHEGASLINTSHGNPGEIVVAKRS